MMSPRSDHRLPVRPKPYNGENYHGYLLRLCAANGYPHLSWLHGLKSGLRAKKKLPIILESIERLTGIPSFKHILEQTYTEFDLPQQFETSHPRICPECIKERGYCDKVWGVIFACACPHHRILLVDSCPQCHAHLSWKRIGLGSCKCGADFSRWEYIKADSDVVYLNARIWTAAGRVVDCIAPMGYPDKDLSILSLKQLCNLYNISIQTGIDHRGLDGLLPKKIVGIASGLEGTKNFLSDWPNGFHHHLHHLLDNCRNEKERFSGVSMERTFGKYYLGFYRSGRGPCEEEFTFIRSAFEKFIVDNWDGTIKGTISKKIEATNTQKSLISFTKARNHLGTSADTLKELVNEGMVKSQTILSGKARITYLDASEIKRLRKQSQRALRQREAQKLLGISKKQLILLAQNKVVRPQSLRKQNIFNQWIDFTQIEELLGGIRAVAGDQAPDDKAIPLVANYKRLPFHSKYFCGFLQAVREGRIPVAGIRSKTNFNLASLYFDPEVIRNFVAGKYDKQKNLYTIDEAATKMGEYKYFLYILMKLGVLESELIQNRCSGKYYVVSETAIERFQSTYVTLSQLALTYSLDRRVLKRRLMQRGIMPISIPYGKAFCYIYRRSDLASLELVPNDHIVYTSLSHSNVTYTQHGIKGQNEEGAN